MPNLSVPCPTVAAMTRPTGTRAARPWLPVALLAAVLAGLVAAVYDAFVWYPDTSWATMRLPYIGLTALSSLVIAGFGSVALTKALAQAGVLDRFAVGRERALV